MCVPLVQVPTASWWGWDQSPHHQDCETWLGNPPSADVGRTALLEPYSAAFGPATEEDLAYFTGVGHWREAIDSCADSPTWLEGPRGERLMDLKGLERQHAATDVCRLVPRYDNIIYAYKDKARFGVDGVSRPPGSSAHGGTSTARSRAPRRRRPGSSS